MQETCHVCGQPLDDIYSVSCIACHREVHFRSADAPGQDCCQILTQLGVCGLAFLCNTCRERLSPTANRRPT